MSKVIDCVGGGQVPRLALFLSSLKFLEPVFPSEKSKTFQIDFTTTHIPNRMLIFLVLKSLFYNQDILVKLPKTSLEEEHLENAVSLINIFEFVNITIDETTLAMTIKPTYGQQDETHTIVLENIRSKRPKPGINNQLFACIEMYNTMFNGYIQFEGKVGESNLVMKKLRQYDLSLLGQINEISGMIKGMATVTLTLQSLMPLLLLIQYHREKTHCFSPLEPLVINILGGEFNGLNSPPLIDYLFFLKLLPAAVTLETKKSRTRQKGVISRTTTVTIGGLTPGFIPQIKTSSVVPTKIFYSLESRRTKPRKMPALNKSVHTVLTKIFAGHQVTSYIKCKSWSNPYALTGEYSGHLEDTTPSSFTELLDSSSHEEFHGKMIDLIKEEHEEEFKRFMLWITLPVNGVPVSLYIEHNPKKPSDIKEFVWFKDSIS